MGEGHYSLNDIFNGVKIFFQYLIRKWWVLLLAAIAGAGIGVIYYYFQQPKYKAASTFILEEKQGGVGAGNIGSIASQFGLDIGGISGGGGIFAGDNILDIIKSKRIVQQVLMSEVNDSILGPTLIDFYLDFNGLRKKWAKYDRLKNIYFATVKDKITPIQDSVLNVVYEKIIKDNLSAERINKKGTIIKVQFISSNSLFARLMADRLTDEAGKIYLDIKTGTVQANINRMQQRSDSLLALLNNKSYVVARSQLLDANPGVKTAAVPTEIAVRDKTVITALYTEITKNLEASKLLLSQQAPVIQLLDKPGILLPDNKKSMIVLAFIFAFISSFAIGLFMTIKYITKTLG